MKVQGNFLGIKIASGASRRFQEVGARVLRVSESTNCAMQKFKLVGDSGKVNRNTILDPRSSVIVHSGQHTPVRAYMDRTSLRRTLNELTKVHFKVNT